MNKKPRKNKSQEEKKTENDIELYSHVEILSSLGVWQGNHYVTDITETGYLTSYIWYSQNQEAQGLFTNANAPVLRIKSNVRLANSKGRDFLPKAWYKDAKAFFDWHQTNKAYYTSSVTTIYFDECKALSPSSKVGDVIRHMGGEWLITKVHKPTVTIQKYEHN